MGLRRLAHALWRLVHVGGRLRAVQGRTHPGGFSVSPVAGEAPGPHRSGSLHPALFPGHAGVSLHGHRLRLAGLDPGREGHGHRMDAPYGPDQDGAARGHSLPHHPGHFRDPEKLLRRDARPLALRGQ